MRVPRGTSRLGYLDPFTSWSSIAYAVSGNFICLRMDAVVVGMNGCIMQARMRTRPMHAAIALAQSGLVASSLKSTQGAFSWKNKLPCLEHAMMSLSPSRICIRSIASMYCSRRGATAAPSSSSCAFASLLSSWAWSAAEGPHMSSREGKPPPKRACAKLSVLFTKFPKFAKSSPLHLLTRSCHLKSESLPSGLAASSEYRHTSAGMPVRLASLPKTPRDLDLLNLSPS
mmetsp:Transcript_9003/g.22190  ORF Transcript_9003/g.22190 Transcript_9003/m.22190 type:complete len:229 (+) Transcript_9003:370-1056(+)